MMASSSGMSGTSRDVSERYHKKIELIMGMDPYSFSFSDLSKDISDFPKTHYYDILNYLEHAISPYTREELRAVKSTEAFKFYSCGWVRDLGVRKIQNHVVVLAKVMHSQRITQKPLLSWAICKPEGEIICAHCTCVAGLGESCSHVGAMLFAVEDSIRNFEPVSVTGKKAYWVNPTQKVGEPSKIRNIEFSTAHKKMEQIRDVNVEIEPPTKQRKFIPEPTKDEKTEFLKKLVPSSSAVLNVSAPYCFEIQEREQELEKEFLTALFDEQHVGKPLNILQEIAKGLDFNMTQEQCEYIEKRTRGENKKLWFGYRRGRVTASVFKRVCRTNISKPSQSLIKQICYPEKYIFSTEATRYGCSHEKLAIQSYKQKMIAEGHVNFQLSSVGLIINKDFTYFGATPDSLVICDCHGEGCVEVKCPYCVKDVNIYELRHIKKLCLRQEDGNLILDRNHSYFYQVQMQLALTGRNYCDFVVWTSQSIFVERIVLDEIFWQRESVIATKFFKHVLVPELLGKHFSKINEFSVDELVWCICKKPEGGLPMVACDNINCEIVWYHCNCIGMTEIPETPWHCNSCLKLASGHA